MMENKEIKTLTEEADKLLDAGRMTEAATAFSKIIDIDPDNADAWLMRGAIQGETGMIDDAIVSIKRSLEIDSENSDAWLSLAMIQQAKGEIDPAIRSALRAVDIDYELLDGWLFLGSIAGQQGKLRESENCSWRAIGLNPDNPDAYINYAHTLYQQGKIEEAEEAYNAALTKAPNHMRAISGLAILYCSQEKTDDVIDVLNKIQDLPLDIAKSCVQISKDYLENDAQRAVLFFSCITKKCPNYVDAFVRLAKAFNKLNSRDEAIANLKQALTLSPGWLEAKQLLNELQN